MRDRDLIALMAAMIYPMFATSEDPIARDITNSVKRARDILAEVDLSFEQHLSIQRVGSGSGQ